MKIKGTRKEVEKVLDALKTEEEKFNIDDYEIVITDAADEVPEELKPKFFIPRNKAVFYYEVYQDVYNRRYNVMAKRGNFENMIQSARIFDNAGDATIASDLLNDAQKYALTLPEFYEEISADNDIYYLSYNRQTRNVEICAAGFYIDYQPFLFKKNNVIDFYKKHSDEILKKYLFNVPEGY